MPIKNIDDNDLHNLEGSASPLLGKRHRQTQNSPSENINPNASFPYWQLPPIHPSAKRKSIRPNNTTHENTGPNTASSLTMEQFAEHHGMYLRQSNNNIAMLSALINTNKQQLLGGSINEKADSLYLLYRASLQQGTLAATEQWCLDNISQEDFKKILDALGGAAQKGNAKAYALGGALYYTIGEDLRLVSNENCAEVAKKILNNAPESGLKAAILARIMTQTAGDRKATPDFASLQQFANQDRSVDSIIGRLYMKHDLVKALHYLAKAACNGSITAALNIGDILIDSDNPAHHKLAYQWISLSASQNNSNALILQGNMYEIGKGVSRNLTSAIQCYQKAQALGHKEAALEIARATPLWKSEHTGKWMAKHHATSTETAAVARVR